MLVQVAQDTLFFTNNVFNGNVCFKLHMSESLDTIAVCLIPKTID